MQLQFLVIHLNKLGKLNENNLVFLPAHTNLHPRVDVNAEVRR